MKLYVNPLSPNARKVIAVANHVKLDIDIEPVDLAKGQHKSPEYLALNPNGKVPTLVDGELKLWESNAIMQYMAGKAKSDLWPADDAKRADISRWQCWQLAHFGPPCAEITYERVVKPMLQQQPGDEDKVKAAEERFHQFAAVLNGALEGKKFLVGDAVTIADFTVASTLTYAAPARIPLDSYTHIKAWLARLDEVPAWKASAPKMG
ncbi:MAG: glutathione S-transferase family protein [Myxococcales bacterium]|nr:glutathione S-transferase family protein [Myxococcales bacterium]